ncbi:MAG: winged helix-turn-helix domain-containing protein, partial [Candidatus Bathyarchaeota archaeon]|nr:winged helix-turn-helix domain-containing protein [Candidatus Bathyarchaeota archaeon]
ELNLDVLKAIYNGRQAPSRVVYTANLSYDRVVNCIDFLLEQKLVQRIDGITKKRYTITDRGKNVVNYFYEIEKLMGRTKHAEKFPVPTVFM